MKEVARPSFLKRLLQWNWLNVLERKIVLTSQSACNELAVLGTIEFYDRKNELVFQTTEEEKSHLVLQLGAPTGAIAVEAAKVV